MKSNIMKITLYFFRKTLIVFLCLLVIAAAAGAIIGCSFGSYVNEKLESRKVAVGTELHGGLIENRETNAIANEWSHPAAEDVLGWVPFETGYDYLMNNDIMERSLDTFLVGGILGAIVFLASFSYMFRNKEHEFISALPLSKTQLFVIGSGVSILESIVINFAETAAASIGILLNSNLFVIEPFSLLGMRILTSVLIGMFFIIALSVANDNVGAGIMIGGWALIHAFMLFAVRNPAPYLADVLPSLINPFHLILLPIMVGLAYLTFVKRKPERTLSCFTANLAAWIALGLASSVPTCFIVMYRYRGFVKDAQTALLWGGFVSVLCAIVIVVARHISLKKQGERKTKTGIKHFVLDAIAIICITALVSAGCAYGSAAVLKVDAQHIDRNAVQGSFVVSGTSRGAASTSLECSKYNYLTDGTVQHSTSYFISEPIMSPMYSDLTARNYDMSKDSKCIEMFYDAYDAVTDNINDRVSLYRSRNKIGGSTYCSYCNNKNNMVTDILPFKYAYFLQLCADRSEEFRKALYQLPTAQDLVGIEYYVCEEDNNLVTLKNVPQENARLAQWRKTDMFNQYQSVLDLLAVAQLNNPETVNLFAEVYTLHDPTNIKTAKGSRIVALTGLVPQIEATSGKESITIPWVSYYVIPDSYTEAFDAVFGVCQ